MNYLLTVLTTVLVALFLVGMGGGVAAETPDPENVSLIESETEADTLDNQEEIQLSNSITLTGWEFSGDRARIGIEAERAERIEVSDNVAGMGESGASRVPVTDQRVFTGSTVVVVPVDSFAGGHAVTVSAGGESLRLSTDMDTEGDDPFRHFGGESGLFSGMLLALFSSMAGAGFVLWREDSGVMKA